MRDPEITHYLKGWYSGCHDSLDQMFPLVYQELKQIARFHFQKERSDHTLQPTVLVNEAYFRMRKDRPDFEIQNRAHFFALAGRVMRQILVDHARKKGRKKRDGGVLHVTFSADEIASPPQPMEILDLHEALKDLEKQDKRLAQIVELRFFTGLTMEETGEVLELSVRTIKREWRVARAWLYQKLNRNEGIR